SNARPSRPQTGSGCPCRCSSAAAGLPFVGRRRIPDPDRLIIAAGSNPPAVQAESNPVNRSGVSLQGEHLLKGIEVPELDRLIVTGRGQAATVGAEGHVDHVTPMAAQRGELLAGTGIPEL